MTMANDSLNRIYQRLKEKNVFDTVTATVVDYKIINNGAAAKMAVQFNRKPNEDTAALAISELTGGRAKLIKGSLREMRAPNSTILLSAAVRRSAREADVDVASAEGWKRLTETKFVDNAGYLWQVVGDGDNRKIVMTEEEDLSEVLKARKTRLGFTTNLDCAAQFGDFASVIDSRGDSLIGGYVFADSERAIVMDPDLSAPITLPAENIYRAINPASVSSEAVINLRQFITTANTVDYNEIWRYLRKAWPAGGDRLVRELKKQVGAN